MPVGTAFASSGATALIGLAATGAVITSAGLVLAGTFAVLGTLPVVAFAEIGFAVAFVSNYYLNVNYTWRRRATVA